MTTNQPYGIFGELSIPMGLGLLKLTAAGESNESSALKLIQHALDCGIRILDTADTYCASDKDLHYGERLARKAVETWDGPGDEVWIITKVGMARPKGRWVPNGRRDHLRKAVEGSLKALDVDCIELLLLHGNDYKTPYEESLAALAEIQQEGKVKHLGLCNVTVGEVRQAQRHFPVCAIQNELSVKDRKSANGGLVELARQLNIPFLAHRPLGGHAKAETLEKNRAMKPIAEKHCITPYEAALATLLDLGHPVIPLIGPTQTINVDSCIRALDVHLTDQDRATIERKISFQASPEALQLIEPPRSTNGLRKLSPGEGPSDAPEVVMVMGIQGAGKSEMVRAYTEWGYERLNRDLVGGKLDDLVGLLESLFEEGKYRVVLDNTYPTRLSRFPIIQMSLRYGVPVRCRYLATPVKEAMINIVLRMLDRYDRLPGPEELKELSKTDPNLPPPVVLSRWAEQFEKPHLDEGFSVVEEIPFQRRAWPPGKAKGLLLDVDGTIRMTRSGQPYPRDPEDIELLPGRRERLLEHLDRGYQLFFVSNQSGVASGALSHDQAQACFDRTVHLLDLPIKDIAFCPHEAFPVSCFCRKPMPGLGLVLARKHQLDMSQVVMVGDMDSDADFASAIGATFYRSDEFFG